ncbi:hypothetical protein ACFYUD_20640 [Nocardia tengchongensis]|uniref:hypothetical protein n=1 Tax=Nocardia tengchongensis TaxID=2055889 RepID=UPI0036C545A9
MRKRRIALALGAFAAVAVSLAGSPLATADIHMMLVNASDREYWESAMYAWSVEVDVTCDPAASPIAPPVYLTDNGQALPGSPVAAGTGNPPRVPNCVSNGVQMLSQTQTAFRPTTLGVHHIVATQYKPDGSVLSTMSQDVNVTQLPGATTSGSAGLPFGS